MPDHDPLNNPAEQFLHDVWGKRLQGLPAVTVDWNSPARPSDVRYVVDRHPYLQLVSTDPNLPELIVPQFYTAVSGWVIHDYTGAMSSSLGKGWFGWGAPDTVPVQQKDEDEGGEGGEGDAGSTEFQGRGTVIKQLVDTAYAMIKLAIEKGWPGAEIIAGTPLMQWAAWMAAQDNNFTLLGYTPSAEDKAKRERIKRLEAERFEESKHAEFRPRTGGR